MCIPSYLDKVRYSSLDVNVQSSNHQVLFEVYQRLKTKVIKISWRFRPLRHLQEVYLYLALDDAVRAEMRQLITFVLRLTSS